VNPDATVDTVIANTFFDPQVAAQAANALLDNGVEFLFGIMDEPTFLQIAEDAGVWSGYWNLDQRAAAPTRYLNNYDLSEFGNFYERQCQAVLDGTWSTRASVDMLDSPLGDWGPEVPQDVQDAVADVASQIADGDLNVYEGPVVDSSGTERVAAGSSLDSVEAYNIDYAVEGVSGL
jgi:basic membrane protein A